MSTGWFCTLVAGVPTCGPAKNRGGPESVGSAGSGMGSTVKVSDVAVLPPTVTFRGAVTVVMG